MPPAVTRGALLICGVAALAAWWWLRGVSRDADVADAARAATRERERAANAARSAEEARRAAEAAVAVEVAAQREAARVAALPLAPRRAALVSLCGPRADDACDEATLARVWRAAPASSAVAVHADLRAVKSRHDAAEIAATPRAVRCCDGETSPTCVCGRSGRGCCSHHGGICGCEPPEKVVPFDPDGALGRQAVSR